MERRNEKRPDVRAQIVRLSPEVHRELKIAAAEDDVSVESILRELIADYLEHRKLEQSWTEAA